MTLSRSVRSSPPVIFSAFLPTAIIGISWPSQVRKHTYSTTNGAMRYSGLTEARAYVSQLYNTND
jgi:hypothetical protein